MFPLVVGLLAAAAAFWKGLGAVGALGAFPNTGLFPNAENPLVVVPCTGAVGNELGFDCVVPKNGFTAAGCVFRNGLTGACLTASTENGEVEVAVGAKADCVGALNGLNGDVAIEFAPFAG